MGLDVRSKVPTPAFVARTSSWGKARSRVYHNVIATYVDMTRPIHHVHR